MSSVNHVRLIGNLGMDPELKTLESGKKLCHFTMATNESYTTSDDQKVSETTWHNIVAWQNTAEVASRLKKGDKILCEGKIVYRSYEDKKGNTKFITEIVIHELFKISTR